MSSTEHRKKTRPLTAPEKELLLCVFVHVSDVSNPIKPREIMLKWTRRVLAEFWRQGDAEQRRGLGVSP